MNVLPGEGMAKLLLESVAAVHGNVRLNHSKVLSYGGSCHII